MKPGSLEDVLVLRGQIADIDVGHTTSILIVFDGEQEAEKHMLLITHHDNALSHILRCRAERKSVIIAATRHPEFPSLQLVEAVLTGVTDDQARAILPDEGYEKKYLHLQYIDMLGEETDYRRHLFVDINLAQLS